MYKMFDYFTNLFKTNEQVQDELLIKAQADLAFSEEQEVNQESEEDWYNGFNTAYQDEDAAFGLYEY